MSEPFLAEIRMFGFNFAPRGWAFCDGQILPINQNQSLFSLLGTTYGGDGRTTFALPELRGRTPVHPDGSSVNLGSKSGDATHTLSAAEMASHSHTMRSSTSAGALPVPSGAPSLASYATGYGAPGSNNKTMSSSMVSSSGGGQAHNNMQPYTAISFGIALQGLFPSRN